MASTISAFTPDRHALWRYDGSPNAWTHIGNNWIAEIYGGRFGLFCISHEPLTTLPDGHIAWWRHRGQISDRDGASLVLAGIAQRSSRLRHLWIDADSAGWAVCSIEQTLGLTVAVVRKPLRWVRCPTDQEPPLSPRRWMIEQTFAWLGRYRRLSKKDKALPATEETCIHLATISLMLARLAR